MASIVRRALDRIGARMGYVRAAHGEPMRAGRSRARGVLIRTFDAAKVDRLTADWSTSGASINHDLFRALPTLRARSRDLAKNSPHVKHFLTLVGTNFQPATGWSLQVNSKRPDGTLDKADNAYIEAKYYEWTEPQNCDVAGMLPFDQMTKIWIKTMARDGEVIVRRRKGRAFGPFGYQLQFIDPARLDHTHNEDLGNGRMIRMGVEHDADNRRIAYHFRAEAVGPLGWNSDGYSTGPRVRIPADEIWHHYLHEWIDQVRGLPWGHAAMRELRDLDGYREASIVNARWGATKMGFYTSPEGDAVPIASGPADAQTGHLRQEAEAGVIDVLPPGVKFEAFDPAFPQDQFGPFVKDAMRSVAVALDTGHASITGDLESVNYSSARVGAIDEREVYKQIQGFAVSVFLIPFYREWLETAILAGALNLPFSRLPKWANAAVWTGRRWDWVDPEKEANAKKIMIEQGLASRRQIILEGGGDPEKVWAELEEERARLRDIVAPPGPSGGASSPAPATPTAPPKKGHAK